MRNPGLLGGPLSDLGAGCCLGRIILGSEAVEEGQELVRGLVSSWRDVQGPGPVQRPLLDRQVAVQVGANAAAIFRAHETILHDPNFREKIRRSIADDHKSAPFALNTVLAEYTRLFEQTQDEYLRERVADLRTH